MANQGRRACDLILIARDTRLPVGGCGPPDSILRLQFITCGDTRDRALFVGTSQLAVGRLLIGSESKRSWP